MTETISGYQTNSKASNNGEHLFFKIISKESFGKKLIIQSYNFDIFEQTFPGKKYAKDLINKLNIKYFQRFQSEQKKLTS